MTVLLEREATTEKACNVCGITKPLSEYHKDRTHKSGYRGECRSCKAAKDAAYKQRKRQAKEAETEEFKARSVALTLKQQANQRAIIRLIQYHRAEFEDLVHGEMLRINAESKGESPPKVWVSL